jgi:hypothetical protein
MCANAALHLNQEVAMDSGDFGSLKLVTNGIYGLRRRLPYDYQCDDCGHPIKIASEDDFNFMCQCGVAHRLRDSQFIY